MRFPETLRQLLLERLHSVEVVGQPSARHELAHQLPEHVHVGLFRCVVDEQLIELGRQQVLEGSAESFFLCQAVHVGQHRVEQQVPLGLLEDLALLLLAREDSELDALRHELKVLRLTRVVHCYECVVHAAQEFQHALSVSFIPVATQFLDQLPPCAGDACANLPVNTCLSVEGSFG